MGNRVNQQRPVQNVLGKKPQPIKPPASMIGSSMRMLSPHNIQPDDVAENDSAAWDDYEVYNDQPGDALTSSEPPTAAIVHDRQQNIVWFGKFGVSSVGLHIAGEIDHDEWDAFIEGLQQLEQSVALIIGDWLAYGDRTWGVTYDQMARRLKRSPDTLRDYAWVCGSVEISLRKDNLTLNHYKAVAKLPYEEQAAWLSKASVGDNGERAWSYRRLEAEINGAPPVVRKTDNDPVSRFQRAFEPFAKRIEGVVKKAEPGHRQQMVQWLREYADQLERGQ